MTLPVRMPAEWEPQDGVLMAWPHEESDWAPYLRDTEAVFSDIICAVSRFEKVVLVVPPGRAAAVKSRLTSDGAVSDRLILFEVPGNDTWARDFGPIFILENDLPRLLDYGFNGWGLKFPADRDNRINRRLHALGAFGKIPMDTPGLILEGGSIETDGRGTLLTTSQCLLEPNRNPHLDRTGIESALGRRLGFDRFLWLESGFLEGDDTDAHIDTLARFGPGDTIVHIACDDPGDSHYPALTAMARELGDFRTRDGAPYRLIPLPCPGARTDDGGERLPATYANFLVINGAVLVPTYNDARDRQALDTVASAFPEREIIGIDCSTLILQHGSLHCVTMQLPEGVLS